ncbi:MAG: hypothetical protein GVY07_02425 [Bacteroidetes bacterium]|nr:hypothetical protein [Bacteroidota bacterium]
MPKTPIVFKSTHRINFSELDPYNHLGTAAYFRYFIDHRMNGLRKYIRWDLNALAELPFMVWTRKMEVKFLQPAIGDQEIIITSYVKEFKGPDAYIKCTMKDKAEQDISHCLMIVTCVSKDTNHSMDWPDETKVLFFEDGSVDS